MPNTGKRGDTDNPGVNRKKNWSSKDGYFNKYLKDKKLLRLEKKWEPLYNWMRDENMNGLKL